MVRPSLALTMPIDGLLPLKTVRFVVERLVREVGTTVESKRQCEDGRAPQRATSISITELAELTKSWPT